MNTPLRPLALALLTAVVFVAAACGGEEGGGEAVETTTSSTAAPEATEVSLTATLSGAEEVPDAGVADGTGTAELTIGAAELCYKLTATMGETPTAAHIHTGEKGVAGDVLVNLEPAFTKGESAFEAENCIQDVSKLAPVAANPAGYYVNIHTAEHPKGAMRGQLSEAGGDMGGGTTGGAGDESTTSSSGGSTGY